MTSDDAPDFAVLVKEMLEKCKRRGLSSTFAQESGVFLGSLIAFMRQEDNAISSEVMGALMCCPALNELFQQEDWSSVLHYGALLVGALSESAVSERACEIVLSARSSVLSQLNRAADRLGQEEEALRFAEMACALADGNPYRRGLALNHRALALQELKRTAEAESCYREAIEIVSNVTAEEAGSSSRLEGLRHVLANNLQSLKIERGESLDDLPDLDAEKLKRHHLLAQFDGLFERPTGIESQHLNHEALGLMERGLHDVALNRLMKARAVADDLSPEMRGNIESNIALCYAEMGQSDEAESAQRSAIRAHESDPSCWEQLATDYLNLGVLLHRNGDTKSALPSLKRAWDILRSHDENRIVSVAVLRSLAMCRLAQGDYRRTKAILDRGLGIYERIRPSVAETEVGHSSTLERYRSLLELYLYLATREGWTEVGGRLIERGKARFWYESLCRLSDVASSFSPFADTGSSRSAGLLLHTKQTLKYNFFSSENETFALVDFGGWSDLHWCDLTRAQLQEKVEFVRKEVQADSSRIEGSEAARELSDALFGHTKDLVLRANEIVISPDGPLWTLPFDALPIAGEDRTYPLVTVAPLVVVPSFAVLDQLRSLPEVGADRVVLLSDPEFGPEVDRLPGTREEARDVASALAEFQVTELQGRFATPESFLMEAGSANLLHVATHAMGDMRSTAELLLSDGNGQTARLSASTILEHEMSPALVFLSTCSSSLGEVSTGEGLSSMGRAFLRAGARSVISSLWRMRDKEIAEFARDFYGCLATGDSVATALWKAKNQAVDRSAPVRSWAGFQLYGDPDIRPFAN